MYVNFAFIILNHFSSQTKMRTIVRNNKYKFFSSVPQSSYDVQIKHGHEHHNKGNRTLKKRVVPNHLQILQ